MEKTTTEEETKLLNKISEYKKEFRETFHRKFSQDADTKKAEGKVFFHCRWVPKEKVEELQRIFIKREKTVSIETLALIIFSVFLNLLILKVFIKFLLP